MLKAKEYEADYWDGDRRYGYGGYRYIEGRWKPVAQALIDLHGLKGKVRILDVGCGKGYLLREFKLLLPEAEVVGFHISPPRPPSRREGPPVPLPRAGSLSLRRQVVRPRGLARTPAQPQNLRARHRGRRDRTGGSQQIHHGRELSQRARAVQHAVLGAHRRG